MKAIVYKGNKTIEVEELKRPEIKNGQALLKVKAAAICGTDLRIVDHGHHLIPEGTSRILGHEIAGIIEAVAPDVKTLKPGMSVAVAPNIHCGSCYQCMRGNSHLCDNHVAFGIGIDGGFAEYMVVPSKAIMQGNIIPMRDGTDFAQAALNEPLSCCYNGLGYTEFSFGETILIIGGGPIGIMHTLLANVMGASKIFVSEISDDRLGEVGKFGADIIVNPNKQNLKEVVLEETNGQGVDVAIVACPVASAHNQALECMAPLGRMNFFGGLPKDRPMSTINANLVHYNYLKIVGTSRQSIHQYVKTLRMIEAKKIDLRALITGRFKLDEANTAFKTSQIGEGLKNIFLP
ncbi:MAG: alcohol dehydrogenase catalytic domain-containing protein [Desulfobacterales bacterium]|nr:MAG: alcohol dehydrogenase catalytic domain-containing protein [Desulfobacterales bacterium]